MTDYRHDLVFGTFVTPQAAQPHTPVRLAQASEAAGLDLVTFQDHPYQAAFVDTWTLLSWTAAVTERVALAGNVLNLAMRPPAVLARAAASLDLLSGGRFELGLGAGAFWDAIEAMGARRLTPGQAVTALEEGIDVIRSLWDVSDRSPLRIDGRFHHVNGAKRGPAPAHEIPIWLGARKPRMLDLVGRKADGWSITLGYLQPGDLQDANARIDDAAGAVGRDPAQVRRIMNISGAFTAQRRGTFQGPPEQWVEELLPFVLDDGMSTLVLMGDDPYAIQIFGQEVAPALREQVATERGSR